MSNKPARPRGTGRIFTCRDVYVIALRDRGTRYSESTGLKGNEGERAARALLKRKIGEIASGRFAPSAERLRLEGLEKLVVAHYVMNKLDTVEHVKTSSKHLRDYFGSVHALDIPKRLPDYIAFRSGEEKAGAGTIRREVAALRRGLNLAAERGLVPYAPKVRNVREAPPRSASASDADVEKVIAALPFEIQPLIRFLALTGWRKREAMDLRWASVDFVAGEVRLNAAETKTGQARVFPFRALPELEAVLKAQRDVTKRIDVERGTIIPNVFHREGRPISSFIDAWKKATKDAGKPGLLVHDLRRSAARRMLLAGVAQPVAMKLLGHKTESIFRRYAIVTEEYMRDGLAKLAGQRG